jgi:hypothetical protein
LRVFALGQRLRRFADHVTHTAGTTNGERVRRWFQDKKAGWYAVLAFEGTGYVLQSDVDAFVEACQCRNQRKAYEPKLVNTVAS